MQPILNVHSIYLNQYETKRETGGMKLSEKKESHLAIVVIVRKLNWVLT